MPDPVQVVLEKLERAKQHVESFHSNADAPRELEAALDLIEELHDEIEEILEDSAGAEDY